MGGLDELIDDGLQDANKGFRHFGPHKEDERVERILEEAQEEMPVNVEIDFIEVSTSMSRYLAKAYWRKRSGEHHYFIRVSEGLLRGSDEGVKYTIKHELVHIWFYRQGYRGQTGVSEQDPLFTYALGVCEASPADRSRTSDVWKDCIEPLLEGKKQ